MSDPIVGIDLGTSNSVVAYADAGGAVRVLADDAGYKIHPSVVSFHPNGGVVVGSAAKQRKVIDPQNTIYSVKRLIGRAYRSSEVQTAKTRAPFQIKEGASGAPAIVTRAGEFAVPEISAIVLDHVRNVAAARLTLPINRAVVTVPASFNDAQRSATATAGAIAGLTVVRVLNEPTAAALAYGHTRQLREVIAVYDFGGGTFDITFLRLDDQVYEVLGTSGDTFLGGDDLDERLVDKMVAKFLGENRIDLRTNEVAMMRLRAVAEQTKIELSRRSRAVVRIDEIAYGPRGAPLNLMIEISRDEFVKNVSDLIDRTFPVCSEAMKLAGLAIDQIADVILVGGTTKIPYVRDQVSKFFAKAPRTDVSPEDAVAAGAALQATSLERILSRRPSSKVAVQKPTDAPRTGETQPEVLELAPSDSGESGATMAPSELTLATRERLKRPTAGYDGARRADTETTRPDTSYSVTRAGLRDELSDPERSPGVRPTVATPPPLPAAPIAPLPASDSGFETRTPPTVVTQPLGRFSRPGIDPPVAPGQKTMLGVPAPAAFEVNLESGLFPGEPRPSDPRPGEPRPAEPRPAEPRPAEPRTTAPGAAAPPPVPRPQRPLPPQQMTVPLPTVQRGPETRKGPPLPPLAGQAPASPPGPAPTAWADLPGPTTQPMAPTVPIAPPTEPTLIASLPEPLPSTTARGIGAQTIIAEPSPASTARGFQPPQSYPVQPLPPPQSYPVQPLPPPQSYPVQSLPPAQPPLPPRPPHLQSTQIARAEPFASQPLPLAPLPAPPPPRAPPIVLEVTPRGLGIGTVAGFCEELIRRNARVPTETRKLFTTSRDRQDLVRIVVCQGESRRLDNNTVIGDLVLQNLPPRPRGETSIEVTFSLDASGVLQVRARDAQTGSEQRASLDLIGDVAQEDVAASRDRLQQLRR